MKPLVILLAMLLQSALFFQYSFSQAPPAQGPQPVRGGATVKELPFFLFNNLLNNLLRDSIIPSINQNIKNANPPVGITVSYSLTPRRPSMDQTQFIDHPNDKVVSLGFNINYQLHINNFPDRKLFQSLQLILACPNWFEPSGGKLQLSVVADPPYLDGPSFTEQAINFFVGNWLTPFIDGKIKKQSSWSNS